MKNRYIVFKEEGYTFGGIIDTYSGKFFIFYVIPRKYLTLSQVEYITGCDKFNSSRIWGNLKYLLDIKDVEELKYEISKILTFKIHWVYLL